MDASGDACDECPNSADGDADEDGVCDDIDNCVEFFNQNQTDGDEDGIDADPALWCSAEIWTVMPFAMQRTTTIPTQNKKMATETAKVIFVTPACSTTPMTPTAMAFAMLTTSVPVATIL